MPLFIPAKTHADPARCARRTVGVTRGGDNRPTYGRWLRVGRTTAFNRILQLTGASVHTVAVTDQGIGGRTTRSRAKRGADHSPLCICRDVRLDYPPSIARIGRGSTSRVTRRFRLADYFDCFGARSSSGSTDERYSTHCSCGQPRSRKA